MSLRHGFVLLPLVPPGPVAGVEAEAAVPVEVGRGGPHELPDQPERGLGGGVRGDDDPGSGHTLVLAPVLAAGRPPLPGHPTLADEATDQVWPPGGPLGQGRGQGGGQGRAV